MRLALTDHPGDEESNSLVYEGAPWSIRLAAKLLREAAKAVDSPWFPFIQVLLMSCPVSFRHASHGCGESWLRSVPGLRSLSMTSRLALMDDMSNS